MHAARGRVSNHAPESAGPEISVIVPCYNAFDTLSDVLLSLHAQTFANWEALLVDDGSTDETATLIDGAARRDPRFHPVRGTHAGLAAARNRGIARARGRFVFFLDADDRLRPTALATLRSAARETGYTELTTAAYRLISQDGQLLPVVHLPQTHDFSVDRLLRGNVLPPHTLVPTHLLKDNPFDEQLRSCEDWDLWLRLAAHGVRCRTLPTVLFEYRLRSASLSRDVSTMLAAGRKVIETHRVNASDPNSADVGLRGLAWLAAARMIAQGRAAELDYEAALLCRLQTNSPQDASVAGIAAQALLAAFTHVGGATGLTWHTQHEDWLRRIRVELARLVSPDLLRAILKNIAADVGVQHQIQAQTAAIANQQLKRLVVYGLGAHGVALLDELVAWPGRPREIAVADDGLNDRATVSQPFPREDPRRWDHWPANTFVVVTPRDFSRMASVLKRAGGRPGVDFICLTESEAIPAPTLSQAGRP